jgi:GWxTD domain-containing protein
MKRTVAFFLSLAAASFVLAQTVPELFMKAKEQCKASAWTDALKTLDTLGAEAAKPGNENIQKQLEGPAAFYRAVCEANLDQTEKARADFEIFLKAQPNASLDRAMYSKKAVAAFDEAKKAAAPAAPAAEPSASLFKAYQEFKPPANAADLPNEKWGDGPVKWLMTADESREWALQTSGAERAEFVQKFWASRNPKPGTEDNIARTAFERRVAFADAHFVQDEKVRGSLTDRGMVFVLLGPPTYVGRKPMRTGDDASDSAGLSTVGSQDASNAQRSAMASSPSGKTSSAQQAAIAERYSGPGTRALDAANNWREVWHYRKELLPKGARYQQVDFEFITKKGYGLNVLQREAAVVDTIETAKRETGPKT